MNTPQPTTITIGWTIHSDGIYRGYVPYWDGYKPGTPQHVETIEVSLPSPMATESIAALVFDALNNPEPRGASRLILDAVQATGYRGEGAHFSLSVGDTVTVNATMLSCERMGWTEVIEETAS